MTRHPGGIEGMTRLVSGVALAAAVLVAIRFLPLLPLRVLACVVAALAAKEYLEIVDSPIRAVVLVIALCWVVSGATVVAALVLLTMALLWVAAEVLISNHSIQQASTGIFAAVYIGMPLGMLVAVHGLPRLARDTPPHRHRRGQRLDAVLHGPAARPSSTGAGD